MAARRRRDDSDGAREILFVYNLDLTLTELETVANTVAAAEQPAGLGAAQRPNGERTRRKDADRRS
jgi:hypothetical protein